MNAIAFNRKCAPHQLDVPGASPQSYFTSQRARGHVKISLYIYIPYGGRAMGSHHFAISDTRLAGPTARTPARPVDHVDRCDINNALFKLSRAVRDVRARASMQRDVDHSRRLSRVCVCVDCAATTGGGCVGLRAACV